MHFNGRKATGCDEVPAWLMKSYHEELTPALHYLCQYTAMQVRNNIVQFNNPTDFNNELIQISILPKAAKFLAKIELMLNKSDTKIDATQNAMWGKRSTITTLTSITQEWFNMPSSTRVHFEGSTPYLWISAKCLIP